MSYENNLENPPDLRIGGVYRIRDGGKAIITQRLRDHAGQEYWCGTIENAGICTWTLEGKDRRGNEKWDLVAGY